MLSRTTFVLLGTALIQGCQSQNLSTASYALSADYSGSTFFEHFDFFSQADPTSGYVKYVDEATANSTSLAGFTSEGNASDSLAAYLGVDATNPAPGGRSSVRIMSKDTFNHALVVADVLHMPAPVCGVWPSLWMLGTAQQWPQAGEIDIIEGVSDSEHNRYTLHTNAGVLVNNDTSTMKGYMSSRNCDVNAAGQNTNEGCAISDSPATQSYGTAFNQNGGGVFVTEVDSDGISIWFFSRNNIPADIAAGAPTPSSGGNSTWGVPNARFTGDNVDFDSHFQGLQIIINTDFCGDWAGKVWSQNPLCTKLASTCEDYVANNPKAFADAYWAINSVKVYEQSQTGQTYNGTSF